MRIDGIEVVEGSKVTNLTVASGTTYPSDPNIGELFFRTDQDQLYNYKSTGWAPVSSGGGAGSFTITGDVTGTIDGGTDVLSLANVNSSPGAFGSNSTSAILSVNAKGLVTSASSTPIQLAETQITNGTLLARVADAETISGAWTFTSNPIISNATATRLFIDGGTATTRGIQFQTGGTNRWLVGVNNTAESGLSAGSDFFIGNYNDTGGGIGVPFAISRATGNITITGSLSGGAINGTTITASSGFVGSLTGAASQNVLKSGDTMTGDLNLVRDQANATVSFTTAGNGITNTIIAQRARGTIASPALADGAAGLIRIVGRGYDGSSYRDAAWLEMTQDGLAQSGIVQGAIRFYNSNSSGTIVESARINAAGNLLVGTTASTGKLAVAGVVSVLDSASVGYQTQITTTSTGSVLSSYAPSGQSLALATNASGGGTISKLYISKTGNVGVGTNFSDSAEPTAALHVNMNATGIPVAGGNVMVSGADSQRTRFMVDSYNEQAGITFRRANGTLVSKTPVAALDSLAFMNHWSWDGTQYFAGASINYTATENWGSNAHGTRMTFATVPNGSSANSIALVIEQDGSVLIGTPTVVDSSKLTVNGTVSAATPTLNTHLTTKAYVDSQLVSASSGPTVVVVSGLTQTAVTGAHYVMTGSSGQSTLTFPASPAVGALIWVSNYTGRTDLVIERSGNNFMGQAENFFFDADQKTVQFRYINATLGWIPL